MDNKYATTERSMDNSALYACQWKSIYRSASRFSSSSGRHAVFRFLLISNVRRIRSFISAQLRAAAMMTIDPPQGFHSHRQWFNWKYLNGISRSLGRRNAGRRWRVNLAHERQFRLVQGLLSLSSFRALLAVRASFSLNPKSIEKLFLYFFHFS